MGFFNNMLKLIFPDKKSSGFVTAGNYVESSPVKTVFEHDYVLACINIICQEISKLQIRSINDKDGKVKQNKDAINALFTSKPNQLQSMADMLSWTAYQLEVKGNAYWYPVFEKTLYGDSRITKKLKSIYPINSVNEDIVFENKEYHLVFLMENGSSYKIPYDEIIHFRKHYGSSYYFGGESRTALLARLNVMANIEKMMPQAIATSMQLRGIVTANSEMAAKNLEAFKEDFIKTFSDPSKSTSIATLGINGEYNEVHNDPKIVDKDFMTYLSETINANFSVAPNIVMGKGTEEEWNSFYQTNVEPFKTALEQAATFVLFTDGERQHGNKIRAYDRLVQNLSMKTRLEMVRLLGPQGYLSRSEQRDLIGYEPDDGTERISLNFVDEELINEYQLKGKKIKEDSKDE